MMYLRITNNRIAAIYCGVKPEDTIDVNDDFKGFIGQHVGEFDDKWNLLPLSRRYTDGYIEAPHGYKLQGDSWVELSQEERFVNGIDPIPAGTKLVDGHLVELSLQEQVASGLMTQEDANSKSKEIEIAELGQYLYSTDWYAARLSETGKEIPEHIITSRQAARERISELRNQNVSTK